MAIDELIDKCNDKNWVITLAPSIDHRNENNRLGSY
jgi:hypothetical protein